MIEANDSPTSAITNADAAMAVINTADGILLDWDGCTATANRPRSDALAFIARHQNRIAIVSNNSTNLPGEISAILAESRITFPSARVFLAGTEALAHAASLPRSTALVLATSQMKAYARNLGLTLVPSEASVVVLLRDQRFSYAKLERAVQCLTQGARLIVSNPDNTHPGRGGALVPETGALLAAIGACVDLSRIDMEIIGKPSRFLFQRACAALSISPQAAVMVGDSLQTDIEGAKALGMKSILIAPGSTLSFNDLVDAPPSHGAAPPSLLPSAVAQRLPRASRHNLN